jgi:hypothetical protein
MLAAPVWLQMLLSLPATDGRRSTAFAAGVVPPARPAGFAGLAFFVLHIQFATGGAALDDFANRWLYNALIGTQVGPGIVEAFCRAYSAGELTATADDFSRKIA